MNEDYDYDRLSMLGSRNNKHLARTDTYRIADKRAGSKMSNDQYKRVITFVKRSKARQYARDMKQALMD